MRRLTYLAAAPLLLPVAAHAQQAADDTNVIVVTGQGLAEKRVERRRDHSTSRLALSYAAEPPAVAGGSDTDSRSTAERDGGGPRGG